MPKSPAAAEERMTHLELPTIVAAAAAVAVVVGPQTIDLTTTSEAIHCHCLTPH